MGMGELILLAAGLAMDAFAVSVCKGLATQNVKGRHMLLAGLWFGGFQALMPLLGYLLGSVFATYIFMFDHWIAFLLLALIGGSMIKESRTGVEETADASFGAASMFPMAVATSIDALAVGVTFALLPSIDIESAVLIIGVVTFFFSAAGVKVGNLFGSWYKSKAELVGGIILILIGSKILLDHMGL